MTKSYYKPPTPIDQAEIIPFPTPEKTWQDKIHLAFEQKPEKLIRFYVPVYVAAEFLDKDTLYEKILTEVEQLREKSEEAYQFAVDEIERRYEKIFCTQDAEIISMGVTHG